MKRNTPGMRDIEAAAGTAGTRTAGKKLPRALFTFGFFPHIELIHCRGDITVQEQFEGIDGSIEAGSIDGALVRRNWF